MASRRKGDSGAVNYFRSERLYRCGSQWFFVTREGTDEGPFDNRADAQARLERYVQVMASGLLSADSRLELATL